MKNDCLLRFIADGIVHLGNQENHQKLINSLRVTIFPKIDRHIDIPPIPEQLAITATANFLSDQPVPSKLSFIPFYTIPYEDYYGTCELLSKKSPFLGLGFDPKRIFGGDVRTKHISRIQSFSEKGAILDDTELKNPIFRSWEDIEKDTLPVYGGFWCLIKINKVNNESE